MVSLITTIKNRLPHFLQTGPTLVTQGLATVLGTYDLIIVNYHSEDEFDDIIPQWLEKYQSFFSPSLASIHLLNVQPNLKFDSTKAKNLGFIYSFDELARNQWVAFSDIDTFIFPDYLDYWLGKLEPGTFMASRKDFLERLRIDINYGNFIVETQPFYQIQGHNESVLGYGGDDDEVWHRLHLWGLEEIRPKTAWEARQTSIVHGDEERFAALEVPERRFGRGLNLSSAATVWREETQGWSCPLTEVITYQRDDKNLFARRQQSMYKRSVLTAHV